MKDMKQKALDLSMEGGKLKQMKNYIDAMDRFQQVLKISNKTNDLGMKGVALSQIAEIQFYQKKYGEALKNFNDALLCSLSSLNRFEATLIYKNMGLLFMETGEKEKSYEYTQKALDYCLKLYDTMMKQPEMIKNRWIQLKISLLLDMGCIYWERGGIREIDQIYNFWNEAKDLAQKINDQIGLALYEKYDSNLKKKMRDSLLIK